MNDGIADLHQVLGVLGIPVPGTPPPDLGSPRRTHVYVVDDVVVKCDDRLGSQSMVRERSALELLAGSDLPVARVLGFGEFDDTRQWIALSRLPGELPKDNERLPHEISPGLAAQLGTMTARLHAAARPPAFGTWESGQRPSLAEEGAGRLAALFRMAREDPIVGLAELDELDRLLAATLDALSSWQVPVLAHRDIQPRNVLVADGRICALLDFESAAGGDPTQDFRVLGLDWTTSGFASFARAYKDADGDLGRDASDRLAHHVLHWALAIYAYVGRIVPGLLEPARVAVDRISGGERPIVA